MATLKQRTKFTYEPLDTTQQSIRLISIDPELSPEGFVQCSIRHTTIDAQYNCLSYRWGPPDLSNTLIVNGQALSINGYLNDFLAEVRTFTYQAPDQSIASHLRENLWIDAVCIDQNSTSEKNHQVGQMGKIYANARKVVMWLGNRYSEYGRKYTGLPSPTLSDYNWFVIHNQYWTRAWIAQEVMLAKDPVLMIADNLTRHLIHFAEYVETEMFPGHSFGIAQWVEAMKKKESTDVLTAWIKLLHRGGGIPNKPWLVDWLSELRGVECTLVHDRIFSLLELSAEGKDIAVDYNMPVTRLLERVLEARGHELCRSEVLLLLKVLEIGNEAIESSDDYVYNQSKAPSSHSVGFSNGVKMFSKESKEKRRLVNPVRSRKEFLRAPLPDLVLYITDTNTTCRAAIHGTLLVPTQVRFGPVYRWQVVLEDRKVKEPLVTLTNRLRKTKVITSRIGIRGILDTESDIGKMMPGKASNIKGSKGDT